MAVCTIAGMTIRTTHHVDIYDLRTFRLKCVACSVVTEIGVEHWTQKILGDAPCCPSCGAPWGDDGRIVQKMAEALRFLQERSKLFSVRTDEPPAVAVQIEIPAD